MPQIAEDTDLFPKVTSAKFPKNVANILRQNGRNVGAMEKSFEQAIQQGGEVKAQAVQQYYSLFDEVGQTSQYRNVLESYQREQQAKSQIAPRDETKNTALATPAPVTAVAESAPSQVTQTASAPTQRTQFPGLSTAQENGESGALDVALKGGWNAIVDKAKGLSQAIIGAKSWIASDNALEDTGEFLINQSLGLATANPNIYGDIKNFIMPEASKLQKAPSPKAAQAQKDFAKQSKAIGEYFDQNWKASIPTDVQQSPVYYDTTKGELNLEGVKDFRKWTHMLGNTIGGMIPDIAIAYGAARVSKGKSPAAQNLIKNGARAATFVSSSAQMFPGYLQDGLDNGLSYGDALKVAAPMAMINGAIELNGLEYMMKGYGFGKDEAAVIVRDVLDRSAKSAIKQLAAKDITQEAFLETVQKSATQAFKEIGNGKMMATLKGTVAPFVKRTIKEGFIPESREEILQAATEGVGKRMYNSLAATKGSTAGNGQFDTNIGEDLTNGFMGAMLGGIVGGMGASTFTNAPKMYDQTMFSYANSDIRHQVLQGAQSLDDIKSQGKVFNKIEEWRQNGEFDTNVGGVPTLDEAKYQQAVDNANLMYDTAWEFRNFKDFNDTDRLDMFNIAKTRNLLKGEGTSIQATKDQVSQIDDMLANYDAVQPDEYGEKPSQLMLENQRADVVKQLGPLDPNTGLYQQEQIFQDRAGRIENIIKQSVPAINETQTRAIGRRFLTHGVDAVEALQNPEYDTFEAAKEIPLADGSVAVESEDSVEGDARIRQLVVSETPASVLDQLESGDYKPVDRYQYRTEPIDDYAKFQEALTAPSRKVARDTTRPYNVAADASEVIGLGQQLAEQLTTQPESAELFNQQLDKAYTLYDSISKNKDASRDGVNPLTREEFNQAIGLQTQAVEVPVAETTDSTQSAEPIKSIRSLIGLPVTFDGKRSELSLDGQTIVASPIGTNQIFEVGNIDEIGDLNPADLNIQPEESIVQRNEDGNFTVRDKVYRNGYSNPTSAINRNKNGDITSVTLDDATTGAKRTFRDQTAQDIAYEIILAENAKDNGTEEQFNRFVEGNEFIQREIMDAESASASEAATQQDTDAVSGSQGTTESTTDTTVINEDTTQGQGNQSDTEGAPSIESQYIRAREFNQAANNIIQSQQELQGAIESANEGTEATQGSEEINERISRLIDAIDATDRQSESIDGQIESLFTQDGNNNESESSDSGISTEGAIQNDQQPQRVELASEIGGVTNQEAQGASSESAQLNLEPGFTTFSFTTPKSPSQSGSFSLDGQSTFYHASPRKRNGRLKVNNAPQFGTGVYLSTNQQLVTDEFGDNVTEVGLNIDNPVYTNTREWNDIEKLAIEKYNKTLPVDEDGDIEGEAIDLSEIPSSYISDVAKSQGYDAIIDKGSSNYDNEVVVLDESKIVYTEDADSQIYSVLDRIGKAFPNVTLNVPATQEEYIQQLNSVPGAREVFTKGSEVPYGYVNPTDGSVNLDPSRLNSNTAIHEYGHIWQVWAEKNNPELYNRGIDLVRQGSYIQGIRNDPKYANLTQKQMLDEALATAIGDKGESFLQPTRKKTFREWLSNLFNDVKSLFGLKKYTPQQLIDIDFETFTNGVVSDLLSGNAISQISSQDVADILNSAGVSNESQTSDITDDQIQENLDKYGDILFSWKPPVGWGIRPGESVGTAQDYKAQAEAMLKSGSTPEEILKQTGWKQQSSGEWINDISQVNNTELGVNEFYFTDDNRITHIPINSPSASTKGTIAKTVENGIRLFDESDAVGRNLKNRALKNLRVENIETLTSIIDDENGLMTQLIKKVKREGSLRKDYVLNTLMDPYNNYLKAMAPFSSSTGGSTNTEVKKIEVDVVVNGNGGTVEQRKVYMPVGTAMNLVRTHKTQLASGDIYLTKPNAKGVVETRGTLILDDSNFSAGKIIDPNDRSILFGKNGIQLGAHLRLNELEEMQSDGSLAPYKSSDSNTVGDEAAPPVFMVSNNEMKRLMKRFDLGVGANPGEVEAFKQGTDILNNKQVQDVIANENDKFLNPSRPFKRLSFYSPLTTVSLGDRADNLGNTFSPNLEDSKRLHEREGRPDAVYIVDDAKSIKNYMDGVSVLLGSGRLVHNLKNIRDAIAKENINNAETKLIVSGLDSHIKAYQDPSHVTSKDFNKDWLTRVVSVFQSNYTKYIFRNINPVSGISMTQATTYGSGFGQGFIADKYLRSAFPSLGKYVGGSYLDTFALAGGSVNRSTGEGLKDVFGRNTVEKEAVDYISGNHISDPARKERFLKSAATLINRTLSGSNLYVAGIDYALNSSYKNVGGKLKQTLNKADELMEKYFMSSIRRNDRAVIFAFMDAAKLQAEDQGLTGEAFDDAVIRDTTNMVFATNQLSDITETTELQRDPNPIVKIVNIYTGQTVKLFNNLLQSLIEWKKYGIKSGTPEDVSKRMLRRVNGALISNGVIVPMLLAGIGVIRQVLTAIINGDDLKSKEQYAQQASFDVLRYMFGIFPSYAGQLSSFVISNIDYEKWSEDFFELPGGDNVFKAAEDLLGAGKNIVTGENLKDKEINTLIADGIKLSAIYAKAPKSVADLIIKRTLKNEKAKRVIKSTKTDEEIADEEIDKLLEGL